MILHIWGKLEIETGLKPKTTLLLVSIFIEHVTSAKNNRKFDFLSAIITNIVFTQSSVKVTKPLDVKECLRQVNIPFPLDIHDYSIGWKLKFKLTLSLLLKHIALTTSTKHIALTTSTKHIALTKSTKIMLPNLSDLPSLQAALILHP